MSFEYIVIYFTVYSFIGWICEICYCSLYDRKLRLNRGMFYGPICPIYGVGALIVVISLQDFINYPFLLFLISIVLTSFLEYLTSFVLEYIFSTLWWDYSNRKFNINGRICALNSFLFGILSVVTIYIINPFVSKHIDAIPQNQAVILAKIIAVVFIADFILTLKTLINIQELILTIKQETEKFYKELESFNIADKINESDISQSLRDIKEKLKQDRAEFFENAQHKFSEISQNYPNVGRILNAFPDMHKRKENLHLKLLQYFRNKK